MMNPQDSAEQRKKEQERITVQNWQERLERRKVIFCYMCFVLINVENPESGMC